MTAKKFPRVPPAASERKALRLPEQPRSRAKLPPLADPAKTKPTLARRSPPGADEGGLVRKEPKLVVPPAKLRLGEPPQEPPRLGGLPQELPRLGEPPQEPPRLGELPPEPPRLAGRPLEAKELARRIRHQAQKKTK